MTLSELRDKVAAGTATRVDVEDAALLLFGGDARGVEVGAAYHGSLDAAKALHDVLLSGWFWTLMPKMKISFEAQEMEGWIARVWMGGNGATKVSHDPARAWLLAILDAKITE